MLVSVCYICCKFKPAHYYYRDYNYSLIRSLRQVHNRMQGLALHHMHREEMESHIHIHSVGRDTSFFERELGEQCVTITHNRNL